MHLMDLRDEFWDFGEFYLSFKSSENAQNNEAFFEYVGLEVSRRLTGSFLVLLRVKWGKNPVQRKLNVVELNENEGQAKLQFYLPTFFLLSWTSFSIRRLMPQTDRSCLQCHRVINKLQFIYKERCLKHQDTQIRIDKEK